MTATTTAELDALLTHSQDLKANIETARLFARLEMMEGVEISFNLKDKTDCRVYLKNVADEQDDPQYEWAASMRPAKAERPDRKHVGFASMEHALKWIFAGAGL